MLQLRPLLVVTGAMHVEGGEKNTVRSTSGSRGQSKQTVVHSREISPVRRKANVVVTGFARRLAKIRLLKTPFGSLIDPRDAQILHSFLAEATQAAARFNQEHKDEECVLLNCMIWEKLRGNRLAAVEGWVSRRGEDPDVVGVADRLVA